jgi:acyl carrier protein
MTKQEFILGLQVELELEVVLNGSTNLKDIEEWDSMEAMVLIGFVSNEFDLILSPNDISEMTTIDSLIEIIGHDKFD